MNWEAAGAVGEIVGAVAVIVTIIYIAVQVRRTSQAARADSLGIAQQVALEETRLWLDNYELVDKSNQGTPLSPTEEAMLQELVMTRVYSAQLGSWRAEALSGGSGVGYHAINLARLLHRNPGAESVWRQVYEMGGFANPRSVAFSDAIAAHLETLAAGKAIGGGGS